MESVKKSILDTLNERISSPLIGGFIISWIFWNYKTILIILSTKSVEDKFLYIDHIIYNNLQSFVLHGMLYPLITSLLFIFIFPYPEKLIYKYWHINKRKLKEVKQEIDSEIRLSKQESRDLLESIIKKESEYYENLEKKEKEIKNLKDIILRNDGIPKNDDIPKVNSSKEMISKNIIKPKKNTEIKESATNLSEDEKNILLTIIENNGQFSKNEIIKTMPFSNIKSEYIFDNFYKKEFITYGLNSRRGFNTLFLTDKGKEYAVKEEIVS